MQYKNLGRSGLKVSQLSYGAWVSFGNQLDVKEAKALLQCCRDHGVNFFDNAEVYANGRAEEIMGQAIRELGWKRSDINLASRSLVDDVLKKVDGLKPIADELGVPLAQLAIAWCAANPNVSSVITGATKESQIQENMKAIDVIPLLTPAIMERIEAVIQSKPKRPESYR
uniref:NADP-dependent oxidoreductase domain-containing protein n=1 Tax=Kalanchoe fedtschenkoi TaxID=63787 RepID=A0A7N0USS8_KALFE